MTHLPLRTQASSPRKRPQEQTASSWAHLREHHYPASSYEHKNVYHLDCFRGHLTLRRTLRSRKAVNARYTDTTLAERQRHLPFCNSFSLPSAMTVQGCRESGTGSGVWGGEDIRGCGGNGEAWKGRGGGRRFQGATGEHLSELHPVMRDAFRLFLSLFRRCKGHYAQFR